MKNNVIFGTLLSNKKHAEIAILIASLIGTVVIVLLAAPTVLATEDLKHFTFPDWQWVLLIFLMVFILILFSKHFSLKFFKDKDAEGYLVGPIINGTARALLFGIAATVITVTVMSILFALPLIGLFIGLSSTMVAIYVNSLAVWFINIDDDDND